jgi:hypothetical protein
MSCESAYRPRGAYTPVAFNRTQVILSSLSVRAWAACVVRVRGVYSLRIYVVSAYIYAYTPLKWSQRFQPHTVSPTLIGN